MVAEVWFSLTPDVTPLAEGLWDLLGTGLASQHLPPGPCLILEWLPSGQKKVTSYLQGTPVLGGPDTCFLMSE